MKWYNTKSFLFCFESIIYFVNYRLSNVIHLQRSLLLQNLLCVSGLTSSDLILVSMFSLLITVLPLSFLLIGKRWYDALSCVHFLWLKSIGVLTVILPSDRVSACLLILLFSQDWYWNGLDYIQYNFSFCQGLYNISYIYSTSSMKCIYLNITNIDLW